LVGLEEEIRGASMNYVLYYHTDYVRQSFPLVVEVAKGSICNPCMAEHSWRRNTSIDPGATSQFGEVDEADAGRSCRSVGAAAELRSLSGVTPHIVKMLVHY
jgi:hypothetical protein